MNNKKIGNKFEEDFAEFLSSRGYWVHLLAGASHTNSQPADIIATKNNIFFIIDCKTLKNKSGTFSLSRAEENQVLAYKKLMEVKSYNYYYAILHENNVYLVPMFNIINGEKTINVKDYIIFKRNFYEEYENNNR